MIDNLKIKVVKSEIHQSIIYSEVIMKQESTKKSKTILYMFLSIMAAMIVLGIIFTTELKELLNRPALYPHVLFLHIAAVTLFFANAVVGILWEHKSLTSGCKEVIIHTYNTVSWLDARVSSPLIIVSVITGIILTVMYGDIMETGWLLLAFLLFLLSGFIWIISDIPTQYKIKKIMGNLDPAADVLPQELTRLLKMRFWISLGGVIPLLVVFILMVYKPGFSLPFQ